MKAILITLAVIILPIIIFIIYKYSASIIKTRKYYNRLYSEIEPVHRKLKNNEKISKDEIRSLASKPELRIYLFDILKQYNKVDYFPETFFNLESEAEADFMRWLLNPMELAEHPEQLIMVKKVQKDINNQDFTFFVYKFREKPDENNFARDWMIGVSGAYHSDNHELYSGPYSSAFCTFEDFKRFSPENYVDKVCKLLEFE